MTLRLTNTLRSAAKNKLFLLLFIFCFFNSSLLFAQRQHLLFENSFEGSATNDAYLTGTIGGSMHNDQHCCSYSIQKATNSANWTARAGTGAVRFELRSTDPVVSQSLRAELTMPNGYTDVGERWYGFSYYFENWQSDSRVSHELQWHPDNSTGAAELQLRTTNNQYEIVHGTEAQGYHHDVLPTAYRTVVPNVWVDLVFHVKFAADATGILQVWKNGVLVVNESNIITAEPEGQYIKIGINNWTWYEGNVGTVTQRVFYIDEIRVGDAQATYCDVAPDLPNDKATGATLLTLGSGCTGSIYSNSCSLKNTGESNLQTCSGITEAPSWFKFNAPASGAVRISTDVGSGNTFTDSKLTLYSATNVNDYATFTPISCDDDGGSALGTGLMSVLYATGLTSGTTYYVAVDKHNSSTTNGSFCITVDELNSSMLATTSTCVSTFQTPTSNGNTTYTGWIPLQNSSGKLVALVKNPAGGAADAYTVSQNINAAGVRTDIASGQKYLSRNFMINNSSVSNASIQFFFLTSELNALHAADTANVLSNLGVTRQTGTICQPDFLAVGGTNTYLPQTSNGTSTDGLVKWIQVTTTGFSNFYLHTSKIAMPVKVLLQGACPVTGTVTQHKAVTTAWANVLNTFALTQPYDSIGYDNYPGPSYGGKEHVNAGFFTSTGLGTDITDWILLELRNGNPGTVVARRAAFVRVDGQVVDLDKISPVSFRGVPSGNYYLDIRHRNHLGIRSSVVQVTNGALGISVPSTYDFTAGQAQAYQNGSLTSNTAMKPLTGGLYALWGGNANAKISVSANSEIRASGPPTLNDYTYLFTTVLAGSTGSGIANIYSTADVNMDGTVRASGAPALNDYTFLFTTVLAGNTGAGYTQHR